MSVGNPDMVANAFPSLIVPKESNARFISPCDRMAGWYMQKGDWDVKNMTDMCGGLEGGPFFIFDKIDSNFNKKGQVFSISSFTKHTAWTAQPISSKEQLWFGLPGIFLSL